MLKLKDFRFSLWLVLQPRRFLYEKAGTGYWVLGFGCWVLGAYSDYFFMIRCGWCSQSCMFLLEKKTAGQPQQSPRGGVMEQTNWAV